MNKTFKDIRTDFSSIKPSYTLKKVKKLFKEQRANIDKEEYSQAMEEIAFAELIIANANCLRESLNQVYEKS